MPADRAEDRLPNPNRSLLDIIAEEGRKRMDQGGGRGGDGAFGDVPRRTENPAATPARLAEHVEAILRGQGNRLPSGRDHVMDIDEGDPVDIRKFALAASLLGDMARRILAATEHPSPAHRERMPRQSGPEDQSVRGIDHRLDQLAARLDDMAADITALRRALAPPAGRNSVAPLRDRDKAEEFSAALGDLKALRDQLQSVSLDRGRPLR